MLVFLETHSLLADLIGPDFYSVGGKPPDQSISFANAVCFDHFLVRAHELIADGSHVVQIDGKPLSLSLLSGLERICHRHPAETEAAGLDTALAKLTAWLNTEEPVQRWVAGIGKHVEFILPRKQMIAVAANATKHHLLRLSQQLEKVGKWCAKSGYDLPAAELIEVHKSLAEELRHALQYYSTVLVELIGGVFLALNRIVTARFAANPTNDVSKMTMPVGVTDDVFRNLYGDLLVFHTYEPERISRYIPEAAWFCRNSYWLDDSGKARR